MERKTKTLRRADKRDKHQIFSIRKFNVGVASVAIAAFWMVSGATTVAASDLDVNPGSGEPVVGQQENEQTPEGDGSTPGATGDTSGGDSSGEDGANTNPNAEDSNVNTNDTAPAGSETGEEVSGNTPQETSLFQPRSVDGGSNLNQSVESLNWAPNTMEHFSPGDDIPSVEEGRAFINMEPVSYDGDYLYWSVKYNTNHLSSAGGGNDAGPMYARYYLPKNVGSIEDFVAISYNANGQETGRKADTRNGYVGNSAYMEFNQKWPSDVSKHHFTSANMTGKATADGLKLIKSLIKMKSKQNTIITLQIVLKSTVSLFTFGVGEMIA